MWTLALNPLQSICYDKKVQLQSHHVNNPSFTSSVKTSTIIMSQSTDFPEPKSLTTMLKSLVTMRSFYCMFLSRAPRSLGKVSSFALSRTYFALTRSGYLDTRPLKSFVIHTNTFFHAIDSIQPINWDKQIRTVWIDPNTQYMFYIQLFYTIT